MKEDKEISVVINYSEDEKQLKRLDVVKARIIIRILSERYGEKVLEQYVDRVRREGGNST